MIRLREHKRVGEGTRFALLAAVLGFGALSAAAADVPAEDAAHHVGEIATVCGVVASGKYDADLKSQPTFLDFEKPYPDQVFTVVIFGSDRSKFASPETTLRGKRVCVTGKIQNRNGLPEIILNDPKQLSQ
jgi:hypothetical protein